MTNLSIIIPHYNIPHLLKRLLDTIPVFENIQVLVVDDNSTEDVDALEQIKQVYSHCEFYKNDTGKNSPGTCRNIGLKHAKGQWVLFADADDYFTDGFFNVVSEYFASDYDAVFFPPTSIDTDSGEASTRHIYNEGLVREYLDDKNTENELNLTYNTISPWSKLISLKCINDNEIFFDDTIIAEEVMFCTKLAYYAKEITASDKVIYVVTTRSKSITASNSDTNVYTSLQAFIVKYKFLKANLSAQELKCLDISGGSFIINARRNGYPLKTLLHMATILRKNKVRIMRRRWLNPVHVMRELKALRRK